MIDLTIYNEISQDIEAADTITEKAKNLFETQIRALEYAQAFGIDLDFFLQEDILFLNESFKAYLLQRLAENSIDVTSLVEVSEAFVKRYSFYLTQNPEKGFIRG